MKFPHILRNIYRTSPEASAVKPALGIIGRILIVLLVIGAVFIFLVKQSESNQLDKVYSLGEQLKNDPGSSNLHLQMALFWEKKFLRTNDKVDFEQAKQEAQIAQQLDPTNIYVLKLSQRLKQEDLEEIEGQISETKKILEQRSDYLEAWQRLAILYEQIGEKTLAQEAREKAAQLNSLGL